MSRAALVLPLCSLLVATPAAANDSSIAFVAGSPRAIDEPDVTMTSERLVFSFVPGHRVEAGDGCPTGAWALEDGGCLVYPHWAADLEYVFTNSGVARTLQIGLPFSMPPADSEHSGPDADEPIFGLRTDVDGEAAPVTQLEQTLSGDGWTADRTYVVGVEFAEGQTRTLRHRYEAFGGGSSSGDAWFSYLLRTGTGWAGPIGSVEIRFELPDDTPCVVTSLPHTRDGRWVVVERSGWEPTVDFDVHWVASELLLYSAGVFASDADEATALCRALDPGTARGLRRAIELWYGAPHAEADAPLLAAPPQACLWADAFAAAASAEAENPDRAWFGPSVRALRFVALAGWEQRIDSAPAAIRACYGVLPTPD